jgi:ComF family protein
MITMEWQTGTQNLYQKILLLVSQCDLCGNSTTKYPLLCSACYKDLPFFDQNIIQGDLLNWPAINRALPNIAFDRLFCLSPYLPPFSHWLVEYKYHYRFELANVFAMLLVEHWQHMNLKNSEVNVDLVLSVPLHIEKWQRRGFNQAHLIAKQFAKKVKIPYQSSALKRIKNCNQVGQTGAQRRKNLANSFAINQAIDKSIKHVILIDDVITTGSTASEISRLLKSQGIESVTLIAVCLTLPKI